MGIRYTTQGPIARITIDRPEAHNAFDDAMVAELQAAWQRFEDGPERVAVIDGGSARHFTVGADLKHMPRDVWQGVPNVAVRVSKPVIAAVHGCVVGVGLAIVQAADLCIAADDASLIYAEPRVGLAYGLISGLAARIPHKLAMEVMLRGQPVDAARAERDTARLAAGGRIGALLHRAARDPVGEVDRRRLGLGRGLDGRA